MIRKISWSELVVASCHLLLRDLKLPTKIYLDYGRFVFQLCEKYSLGCRKANPGPSAYRKGILGWLGTKKPTLAKPLLARGIATGESRYSIISHSLISVHTGLKALNIY